MRIHSLILGCLLIAFMGSCRSQKRKKTQVEVGPVAVTDSVKSQEVIEQAVPEKENKLVFFPEETDFSIVKLKSQVEIKSSKINQSFPASIQIRKDSVIWVSVAIGLEAARAVINNDSAFLLDRLNRKYYRLSLAQLSRQLNFDLSYGLIQGLILGNMPVRPDSVHDSFGKEPGYNVIFQKRNSVGIENRIDVSNNKLFAIEASDEESRARLSISYKDFVLISEKILPQIVSMIVRGEGDAAPETSITFEHSRFDFSARDVKFPFSIPKTYSEGKINF